MAKVENEPGCYTASFEKVRFGPALAPQDLVLLDNGARLGLKANQTGDE
jgi:hypothetical protein